jgi:hypothetical protein
VENQRQYLRVQEEDSEVPSSSLSVQPPNCGPGDPVVLHKCLDGQMLGKRAGNTKVGGWLITGQKKPGSPPHWGLNSEPHAC